jgi:FkbM family methyltransferase
MSVFKKIVRRIHMYLKYPYQFWVDFYTVMNSPKAKRLGIQTLPPNYLFFENFDEKCIIIDVGCGFQAEFSCALIDKYKVKAYAVDPTLKHKTYLNVLEEKYRGNFIHVQTAVSKTSGKISFYETLDNESGSILSGHKNIIHDTIRTYEVDSVNLVSLLERLNLKEVDLLKLDLEGAEFDLLKNILKEDLEPYKQIFVEFHHLTVKEYSKNDTKKIVKRIKTFGFKCFSLDHESYLFYK